MSGIETPVIEKESYRIRLTNFEGPLDLLLFLIRKEEMDIYDIQIAEITAQYLAYIEIMKELDLEIAGEFILMAATLIQIKAKMLLPRPELEDMDEAFETDPRADLVRQLLEYKRFKEVAESMWEMEDRQSRHFPRTYFGWQEDYKSEGKEVVLKEMTMFDLLAAFKRVLDNAPQETFHVVGEVGATIEDQIEVLRGLVQTQDKVVFSELMQSIKNRVTIIVTFMAILELIKLRQIVVKQSSVFEEIWIMRR